MEKLTPRQEWKHHLDEFLVFLIACAFDAVRASAVLAIVVFFAGVFRLLRALGVDEAFIGYCEKLDHWAMLALFAWTVVSFVFRMVYSTFRRKDAK